jgi:phosphohistidine phosphatase
VKEIILIRHATAEDRSESEDISRILTENGKTESADIGLLLSKLRKKVDLIITSDAKRALETADNLQTASYSKVERKIEQKLFSGNIEDYLKTLKKLNEKYDSVILVAHNPVLRELVAYFLNENISSIVFPKASIYSFRIDCDTWKSINSNYSELSLFIKKSDIEIITSEFTNKKTKNI